jgi:hypothetical protein
VPSQLLNEDVDVLTATTEAIRTLQDRMGIFYAGLFSPLHDDGIRDAMRRLTIYSRGEPLGVQDLEAVSPPVFGRYALIFSTDVDSRRQAFALRHGMGHVVCGHVTEPTYMSERDDHMQHRERVADLFALADLFPAHMIESLRTSRTPWRAVRHAAVRSIRHHTINWPESRVEDRAGLRLALYRGQGL